jgi:hypothetical protein
MTAAIPTKTRGGKSAPGITSVWLAFKKTIIRPGSGKRRKCGETKTFTVITAGEEDRRDTGAVHKDDSDSVLPAPESDDEDCTRELKDVPSRGSYST